MRAAIEYDLWVVGHTTADASDPAHARRLAAGLLELYGLPDLRVTFLPPKAREPVTRGWEELDAGELAEIYGRGGINLADPDGNLFVATLDWQRVPARERKSWEKNLGKRQNRLQLSTGKELLVDPAFRAGLVELAAAEALALDANLLYGYDRRVSDDRYRTAEGIGAGLRDVYWLNVYGPAFVELIGAERLLSAPAETRRLDGHVLLLAPDEALGERGATAAIRAHLGEEHFVPPGEPKGFRDTTGARRRPSFDWSGIVEGA